MTTKSVLHVVFGTGPLGMATMRELLARGKRVRMVNRSGKANLSGFSNVEIQKGDVTNPAEVRQLVQEATVTYICSQPAYTKWPQKFPPMIQSIIEGTTGSQTRLVFGDNLYMYGPVTGPIKESLPYNATGHKGVTRAKLATMLLDAHKSGKVQVTIGRASDFYGPGVINSSVGEIVFGAMLQGKTVNAIGNIDAPHTYMFINDFGRGLVTLGEHEEAFGEAWHIPCAETITTRQFIELIAKEVGVTPKILTASKLMISMLGVVNPEIREIRETYYQFSQPFVVDSSKFERAFGSQTTPHIEAIRQTVQWYREHLQQKVAATSR